MYIPKRYGESQANKCPFCADPATTTNGEKVPVCQRHKDKELGLLKCMCGRYLAIMHGKFGVFFNCLNCGNINLKKALEINNMS